MTDKNDKAPLRILELTASNIKRLRAVTIHANGQQVVLAGRNAAGKSSVLDAIAMALGGAHEIPTKPIRDGEERADVVLDLGEYVVRRTFTAAGGGTLTITNQDGARFGSPQAMLDSLLGGKGIALDPLRFMRQTLGEQASELRRVTGLDFSDLDATKARVFAERTDVAREQRRLTAVAAAHARDLGDEPVLPSVDVAALAAEMDQIAKAQRERDRLTSKVAQIDEAMKRAEKGLDLAHRAFVQAQNDLEIVTARLQDASSELDSSPAIDEARKAELRRQIETASQINKRHDLAREGAKVAAEADTLAAQVESLTAKLEEVALERAQRMREANLPVPGLGFGEDGTLTFGGIPIDQASAAEKLRLSVAIGLAANPRIRVMLVRDAALLDRESMEVLVAMAEQAGAQLWIERIEQDGHTTVMIEDGEAVSVHANQQE